MDYAEPPLPWEEDFTDLVAVRDLASGLQLLWLPVPAAKAATTVAALVPLFVFYGAPLVLKVENGHPFVIDLTQEFLRQWQGARLYPPSHVPEYNRAREAGIGSMKARTHDHTPRQGHPANGRWPTRRQHGKKRIRWVVLGSPGARRRQSTGPGSTW